MNSVYKHYSCIHLLSIHAHKCILFIGLVLSFCYQYYTCTAQTIDSSQFNKKKFTILATTAGVGYNAGMVGLAHIWYKDQLTNSFTFFNDNGEWNYMDKMGHLFTSFHLSYGSVRMLQWTGSSRKKSIWYGGLTGAAIMLPIEIFDGFSQEYGASWGDATANTMGSIAVVSQYLLWDEIRITPKFSYHETSYATLRPNTLGSTPVERALKDYNGQTYWLSFNIASLTHSHTIPRWLNVSVGYGAKEMVYALPNENNAKGYRSYTQGFLSLDVDFTRIKTKSKFFNSFLHALNLLHVPLPTLEYSGREGFVFHPIYY